MTLNVVKLKLTGWYLLIIMTLTLTFSTLVYTWVMQSAESALLSQRHKVERRFQEIYGFENSSPNVVIYFEETLGDIRERVLWILTLVNIFILGVSGGLSYFLAGKALEPIEEMMDKQNRFVSDAAHEMRTPLTAMKTDLEVTLRDKDLSIDEAKETIRGAITEVDKLHYFSNALLEKSRYASGVVRYEKEDIKLDKFLTDLVKNFEKGAEAKDVKVRTNLNEVSVKGNPEALNDLFNNLIDNAIKYNREGGVIDINLTKDNRFAKITVKDSGIGIPKDDIPYIFDPFYRADKSRAKTERGGYGLGLSIVKEIVANHNGTIDIESEEGRGSKFIVRLPLSKVQSS